jgi:hypothetical protein
MQILPTFIVQVGGGGGGGLQPGGVPTPVCLHLAACALGKSTIAIVNVIRVAAVSAAMTTIAEIFMQSNLF